MNPEPVQVMAPSEAQLRIDQEIAELHKSIQLLKRERNEHSLIARLPPEILGKVFAVVASTTQQGRVWRPSHQFNFSYVSEHWRNVALTTPEIWGNLPNGNLKWSRIMLERSKTTDLTFDVSVCDVESEGGKFVKEVLVDHAYRLKLLKIRSSLLAAADIIRILGFLPQSAPRLRTLCLDFNVLAKPLTLAIPQASLADVSLSSLELRMCNVDWKSSILVGLRQLKVHHAAPSSPSDLIDALRSMPLLTHLELENALPAGDLACSTPQVSLPHLLKLAISASTAAEIANLLRTLVVPTSATVDLACKTFTTTEDSNSQWPSFVSALNAFFSSTNGKAVFRTLSISHLDDSGYFIEAWCKVWRPSTGKLWYRPRVRRHFSLHIRPSDHTLFQQLISAMPLSQLAVLTLSKNIKHTALISTFNDLPKIETIVIDGSSGVASQVVKAMVHRKNKTKSAYYRPPFPHLENFIMNNVVFSEQNADYVTCEQLVDCLIERVERGAPIQKLGIFEAYDLYQEDVQGLEEIVPEVDWDEEEREYESEEDSEEEDMSDDPYYYDEYGSYDGFSDYLYHI